MDSDVDDVLLLGVFFKFGGVDVEVEVPLVERRGSVARKSCKDMSSDSLSSTTLILAPAPELSRSDEFPDFD